MSETGQPIPRLRPGRRIRGMSAMLLPHDEDGGVDWLGFERHLRRTVDAGLTPAVNMDTGYVDLLAPETRIRVLDTAREIAGRNFVAGAQIADQPGDRFDAERMRSEMEKIQKRGGVPVVFPCHGLAALSEAEWLEAHRGLATDIDQFLGFELGTMFAPSGRILSLDGWSGLLEIPACIGAKHSSLSRELEWQRLARRDERRPDFMVLTGNDLAIDMVMWGSDYLLGLSTFAPDIFARRDALWAAEDPAFYEFNDLLQALGAFAFRAPVPAYKHDAAIFLHLRGWIASPAPHPHAPTRPASDREVLQEIALRMEALG